MNTFLIAVSSIVVIAIVIAIARRRTKGVDLAAFMTGVAEAADAGERAYRAQVKQISSDTGRLIEASPRGLALARLLCASFPASAYGLVYAGNAMVPQVKMTSPLDGKKVFDFASGTALKPLGITPSHSDFADIKSDSNEAVREFIAFFNSHFKADPVEGLASAEAFLAPQWQKALEISLGPTKRNLHTTQFCTSGLHLFITWVKALSK